MAKLSNIWPIGITSAATAAAITGYVSDIPLSISSAAAGATLLIFCFVAVVGFSAVGLLVLQPVVWLTRRWSVPIGPAHVTLVVAGSVVGWLLMSWLPKDAWIGGVAGAVTAAFWFAFNSERLRPATETNGRNGSVAAIGDIIDGNYLSFMTSAPPTVADNPSHHRFEIDLGDGEFAFAAYNLLPGAIRFYHTEVPESHGGQGLGTALIEAGLAAARERGLQVIPVCPFFAAYLRKHAEQQDLVPAEHRRLIEE